MTVPMDGATLHFMVRELEAALCGGRVEKVLQPEKDELHLLIRNNRNNYRLVLSASANHPRAHFITQSKSNPLQAPMFCMLLRKRLIGAQVLSVSQPGPERILEMRFLASDELKDKIELTLRTEIMGRYSNIILTDSSMRILDCIRHVTDEMSRVRALLPGIAYEYPPAQEKADLFTLTANRIADFWETRPEHPVCKQIADCIAGLSLITARSIACSALADPEKRCGNLSNDEKLSLTHAVLDYIDLLQDGEMKPVLVRENEWSAPTDFAGSPMALYPAAWQKPVESLSAAMEAYYDLRDASERSSQHTTNMLHVVRTNLQRCRRKLEKQEETLAGTEKMDQYRLFGELLTVYHDQVPRGAKKVDLPNYYDPENSLLSVPLDPAKGAMENARIWYAKYRKAQVASTMVHQQIADNTAEIDYLESMEANLTMITGDAEIQEMREELLREGYIKEKKDRGYKQLPASKPLHFRSSDGLDIYVGRNNVQNDRLTLKTARKADLWLHTQKIHGSHVILVCGEGEIPDNSLEEAALLAAYYSQARASSQVPVDYTRKANVKKPSGAKPGFVVYTPHQTVFVSPTVEKMARIRTRQIQD